MCSPPRAVAGGAPTERTISAWKQLRTLRPDATPATAAQQWISMFAKQKIDQTCVISSGVANSTRWPWSRLSFCFLFLVIVCPVLFKLRRATGKTWNRTCNLKQQRVCVPILTLLFGVIVTKTNYGTFVGSSKKDICFSIFGSQKKMSNHKPIHRVWNSNLENPVTATFPDFTAHEADFCLNHFFCPKNSWTCVAGCMVHISIFTRTSLPLHRLHFTPF